MQALNLPPVRDWTECRAKIDPSSQQQTCQNIRILSTFHFYHILPQNSDIFL